ncbi:hypothetical protein QBD01_004665 [Ochrobactrum sp. 19YEA23]|nr:hypothetical protein [Ochrobactrum sp. 19YEA23]
MRHPNLEIVANRHLIKSGGDTNNDVFSMCYNQEYGRQWGKLPVGMLLLNHDMDRWMVKLAGGDPHDISVSRPSEAQAALHITSSVTGN